MNGEAITVGLILTIIGATWHYRAVTPVGLDRGQEVRFRRSWPIGVALSLLGLIVTVAQSGSWVVLLMSTVPAVLIVLASRRVVDPPSRDVFRTAMFLIGYVVAVVVSATADLVA